MKFLELDLNPIIYNNLILQNPENCGNISLTPWSATKRDSAHAVFGILGRICGNVVETSARIPPGTQEISAPKSVNEDKRYL